MGVVLRTSLSLITSQVCQNGNPLHTQKKASVYCSTAISATSVLLFSRSVVSDSLRPLAVLLCPWGFLGKNTEMGLPFPPPEDLSNPGIEPTSPALQVDFLTTELAGKPNLSPLFKGKRATFAILKQKQHRNLWQKINMSKTMETQSKYNFLSQGAMSVRYCQPLSMSRVCVCVCVCFNWLSNFNSFAFPSKFL